MFEDLGKRKLKEAHDFEWQRNMRLYFVNDEEDDGKCMHVSHILRFSLSENTIILFTVRCFYIFNNSLSEH